MYYITSKVTAPQDAHRRLVLQVCLGSNTLEFGKIFTSRRVICALLLWSPFFFRVIPIYGVPPYAMVRRPEEALDIQLIFVKEPPMHICVIVCGKHISAWGLNTFTSFDAPSRDVWVEHAY